MRNVMGTLDSVQDLYVQLAVVKARNIGFLRLRMILLTFEISARAWTPSQTDEGAPCITLRS